MEGKMVYLGVHQEEALLEESVVRLVDQTPTLEDILQTLEVLQTAEAAEAQHLLEEMEAEQQTQLQLVEQVAQVTH
jgi:hypothetical protein